MKEDIWGQYYTNKNYKYIFSNKSNITQDCSYFLQNVVYSTIIGNIITFNNTFTSNILISSSSLRNCQSPIETMFLFRTNGQYVIRNMCSYNNSFGSDTGAVDSIYLRCNENYTKNYFEDSSFCDFIGKGVYTASLYIISGEQSLKNLNFSRNDLATYGAFAIFNTAIKSVVKYCTVENSQVSVGRMLFCRDGEFQYSYLSIISNSCPGDQGFVFSEGNTIITIDECSFYNNSVNFLFESIDWITGVTTMKLFNNKLECNQGTTYLTKGTSTIETKNSNNNRIIALNILGDVCKTFKLIPDPTCPNHSSSFINMTFFVLVFITIGE